MNGGSVDFLKSDTDADSLYIMFMEKQEIISKHAKKMQEVDQLSGNSCTFQRTLWKLKTEMLHLIQHDIHLWKKLRELDASLGVLKEDLRQHKPYRPRPDSLLSASSGTDSFVSAEEYNDVIFTDTTEHRVLLWIENCDFSNKDTCEEENTQGGANYSFKSRTCSYVGSKLDRTWTFQDHFRRTCIIDKLLQRSTLLSPELNPEGSYLRSNVKNLYEAFQEYSLDPCFVTFKTGLEMKSSEETEIVSKRHFTYYKSSLRLLGSVRMQSRIFEPSLTKWRPFALSQTSDSYIIVPPKAFSNIQPRPKLHRLANIFDGGTVLLQAVRNDTQETKDEGNLEKDGHGIRENVEETENSENSHSGELAEAEQSESEQNVESARNEFKDDTNDGSGSKCNAKTVSEDDIDLFNTEFLEVKDGLITCRIITPDVEQELKQAILKQNEFEYLTVVDGRVTFRPHTPDSDNEESYFLGWLFGNKEFENFEESFDIYRLFEEADTEVTDEDRDDFNVIHSLLKNIQHESVWLADSYDTDPKFLQKNTDHLVYNDKNTNSLYKCQMLNDKDERQQKIENTDTNMHCNDAEDLNISSEIHRHLENEIERQSCDENDLISHL